MAATQFYRAAHRGGMLPGSDQLGPVNVDPAADQPSFAGFKRPATICPFPSRRPPGLLPCQAWTWGTPWSLMYM